MRLSTKHIFSKKTRVLSSASNSLPSVQTTKYTMDPRTVECQERIRVIMIAHKEECEERIRVSKQQLADITEKSRLLRIEHEKNLHLLFGGVFAEMGTPPKKTEKAIEADRKRKARAAETKKRDAEQKRIAVERFLKHTPEERQIEHDANVARLNKALTALDIPPVKFDAGKFLSYAFTGVHTR